MAMTSKELAQRALILLAAGNMSSPWMAMELEALQAIRYTMQKLGMTIADDPERRQLLVQDYSINLSSGEGDLTTAVGSLTGLADIVWNSVPRGRVKDSNGTPLIYVPETADFEGYVINGPRYYTIRQGKIFTRTATGDYGTDRFGVVEAPLTVTANYFPSIGSEATLPAQIEDDAVRILAETLTTKFAAMAPAAKQ